MIPLIIIACYLALLLGLGGLASRFFRGTGKDYMLASHTIGPVLLLMSLFGTTMTAFALVGSTGEAYRRGIGVYGLLASSSGIVHSLCFFLLGPKLWSWGKRHGYTTQIQFFRSRLQSDHLGLVLFPILVGLVILYLLIGVMGAGITIAGVCRDDEGVSLVSPQIGSLIISVVVLIYVFFGGMRATAWANTFQTMVFMVLGLVTFAVIASQLGGVEVATRAVQEKNPGKLDVARSASAQIQFISYLLIPLSVGMFPHVFQHWLTARKASTFKLPVIAHPIFIMIVWVPCVLVGVWATSVEVDGQLLVPEGFNPNAVLIYMVDRLTSPLLTGFLAAGVLAAIMSSLDSQFLCLGSIFTNDIFLHYWGEKNFSEKQVVWLARGFVTLIVTITYILSILATSQTVFSLGIWCFTGFTGLFPLVFAAVYWKRLTLAGAYATIAAVVISWSVLFCLSNYGAISGYTYRGLMPVVLITACSTVTMVVVSLLTRPPAEEVLDRFFPQAMSSSETPRGSVGSTPEHNETFPREQPRG